MVLPNIVCYYPGERDPCRSGRQGTCGLTPVAYLISFTTVEVPHLRRLTVNSVAFETLFNVNNVTCHPTAGFRFIPSGLSSV